MGRALQAPHADQGDAAHDRPGNPPTALRTPERLPPMILAHRRLCDHGQRADNGSTGAGLNQVKRGHGPGTFFKVARELSLFGDELRRLRRRSGLSQETLAARAGLSPEAVSLLERGRRSPRMTTMRMLADALRLREIDRSSLFATAQIAEPSRAGAAGLRRRVRRPRRRTRRAGSAGRPGRCALDHHGRTGRCRQDPDRRRVRGPAGQCLSRRCALDAGRSTGRARPRCCRPWPEPSAYAVRPSPRWRRSSIISERGPGC